MAPDLIAQAQQAAQAEADFGQDVAWRIVGSKIVAFGGNDAGEIYLTVEKAGSVTEFIVGKDEAGEITLYELEKRTPGAAA